MDATTWVKERFQQTWAASTRTPASFALIYLPCAFGKDLFFAEEILRTAKATVCERSQWKQRGWEGGYFVSGIVVGLRAVHADTHRGL